MVRSFPRSTPPVKGRRQEHAESTRQALLDATAELVERDGFASTSMESIARRARVTKGALYHHFAGKQELFEAVLEDLAASVVARVLGQALAQPDHRTQLRAGLAVVLDACLEPRHRRLVLQEGPVALGWARWRAVTERHLLALLRQNVEMLVLDGRVTPTQVDMLARLLLAAVDEAALVIAEADDPEQARGDAGELLDRLVAGLG